MEGSAEAQLYLRCIHKESAPLHQHSDRRHNQPCTTHSENEPDPSENEMKEELLHARPTFSRDLQEHLCFMEPLRQYLGVGQPLNLLPLLRLYHSLMLS